MFVTYQEKCHRFVLKAGLGSAWSYGVSTKIKCPVGMGYVGIGCDGPPPPPPPRPARPPRRAGTAHTLRPSRPGSRWSGPGWRASVPGRAGERLNPKTRTDSDSLRVQVSLRRLSHHKYTWPNVCKMHQ